MVKDWLFDSTNVRKGQIKWNRVSSFVPLCGYCPEYRSCPKISYLCPRGRRCTKPESSRRNHLRVGRGFV